ncbi:ORF3 [Bemisia tabaci arlivirus 1]|uniref:ORF3 n=1 Tax=Bemisia tabaci arlivirus 1 TaxID=2840017 RepID=A0A8E8FUE9_9MONO|nr:ORF3 [Bemisia tabaci arlivirus 1]QWC36457.1 ORF3 [Bemisia tabaci arlivirus 1]
MSIIYGVFTVSQDIGSFRVAIRLPLYRHKNSPESLHQEHVKSAICAIVKNVDIIWGASPHLVITVDAETEDGLLKNLGLSRYAMMHSSSPRYVAPIGSQVSPLGVIGPHNPPLTAMFSRVDFGPDFLTGSNLIHLM